LSNASLAANLSGANFRGATGTPRGVGDMRVTSPATCPDGRLTTAFAKCGWFY
jgi:hypothetical protein